MADYGAIGSQIGGLFGEKGGQVGSTIGAVGQELFGKKPKQPKIIVQQNSPQDPVGGLGVGNPLILAGVVGVAVIALVVLLRKK